jgi:hypothetical protein
MLAGLRHCIILGVESVHAGEQRSLDPRAQGLQIAERLCGAYGCGKAQHARELGIVRGVVLYALVD